MKTIRLLLFVSTAFAASLAAADGSAPATPGLPAGAVQTAPFTWSYADAHGHKWIYRQTPFGLARLEDKPDPQAALNTAMQAQYLKAVDAGDSVRFERPGPFGTYRWETRKTALSVVEQAAWDRDRAAAGK